MDRCVGSVLALMTIYSVLMPSVSATSFFGAGTVDDIGDTIDDIGVLMEDVKDIMPTGLGLMMQVMLYVAFFAFVGVVIAFLTGFFDPNIIWKTLHIKK